MRQLISRIILILLLLISLAVGCFPVLANSTVYHILYLFLLLATVLYLIIKIKSGNFKYNIFFLIILGISILGVFYRKEKHIIDALGLVCILFSYYIFEMSDIDEKFLNKIALLVSFSVIPTLIFNGMFNQSIIAGTAFSGRLNPFMYFPYILIAIQYNKSKQMLSIFLKIILIFVFIDIIWSGSRVAFLSMVVMSIMYIFLNREKVKNTNFPTIKTKKKLIKLLLLIVIFQIFLPQVYLRLYDTYRKDLNDITLEITGKSFFSGRQRIWSEINYNLKDYWKWGTGDLSYKDLTQPPHNEFMNLYYCWGIFIALVVYVYLYSIGVRCIKNATNRIDLLIILGFISMLICTTFETYAYAVHFFIYNNLLVSYLLNKNKLKKG